MSKRYDFPVSMKDRFNKSVHIASDKTPDFFSVIRGGRIVARIYKLGFEWYVAYERICLRKRVSGLTEAIKVCEAEF